IKSVMESDFDNNKLKNVVINNASTDDSWEVIQKIKSTSQIKLTGIKKNKNSGLAKTRNEAINKAAGKYLFFLDSDNFITKKCLKAHYEFLSKNEEYSSCYAPIQRFDDTCEENIGLLSNQAYDFKKLCKGNYIDA